MGQGIKQNQFCSVEPIIGYILRKPTKNSSALHANWKI